MYSYSICPKVKVSGFDYFDYLSQTPLEIGSIVEIPLGRSKTKGVVLSQARDSSRATKEIVRKISAGPFFTKAQIQLAHKMREEYCSNLGETIFAFMPTMNIGDIKKIGATDTVLRRRKLHKDELFLSSAKERLAYYCELAARREGQVAIILPEIKDIVQIVRNINKISPNKKVFAYHSGIGSSQKRKVWHALQDGLQAIVVTTRQGLLLPFTDLELLCLDDPINFAHQEDQAPYYQAYFTARELKKIHGCGFVVGESIPDSTSYVGVMKKRLEIKTLKSFPKITLSPSFDKFDQNIELLQEVKKTINGKGRVCFIGPWRNQVRFFCGTCQRQLSCPSCQSEFFNENDQSCVLCGQPFYQCRSCRGTQVKKSGFSYGEIKRRLIQAFPEFKNEITDNPLRFSEKQIVIASPNDIAKADRSFDLAVFPYFDKMADFAFLGYRHKLFRIIYDLSRLYISRVFLMGNDLAENDFANQIKNFSWEPFLKSELKNRSLLAMPPFGRAVEIVCKGRTQAKAEENFNKVREIIKRDISLIDSTKGPGFFRIRGLFFEKNQIWSDLKIRLLSSLPNDCHIEVNRGDYL